VSLDVGWYTAAAGLWQAGPGAAGRAAGKGAKRDPKTIIGLTHYCFRGIYLPWKRQPASGRQSTSKDFQDQMDAPGQRKAFATVRFRTHRPVQEPAVACDDFRDFRVAKRQLRP
jgi:hypothetical protein